MLRIIMQVALSLQSFRRCPLSIISRFCHAVVIRLSRSCARLSAFGEACATLTQMSQALPSGIDGLASACNIMAAFFYCHPQVLHKPDQVLDTGFMDTTITHSTLEGFQSVAKLGTLSEENGGNGNDERDSQLASLSILQTSVKRLLGCFGWSWSMNHSVVVDYIGLVRDGQIRRKLEHEVCLECGKFQKAKKGSRSRFKLCSYCGIASCESIPSNLRRMFFDFYTHRL